jgi:hypothetical protein
VVRPQSKFKLLLAHLLTDLVMRWFDPCVQAATLCSEAKACYHNHVIPNNLMPFFWDIDARGFDPAAHPEYAIGRILELGNPEAVLWMRATFSEEQIRTVIRTEHRLSPKSATFWALVYHIPCQDVAAFASAPS